MARFVIWAVVLPLALFGYFVPFVHLVEYAKTMPLDADPGEARLALLHLRIHSSYSQIRTMAGHPT